MAGRPEDGPILSEVQSGDVRLSPDAESERTADGLREGIMLVWGMRCIEAAMGGRCFKAAKGPQVDKWNATRVCILVITSATTCVL